MMNSSGSKNFTAGPEIFVSFIRKSLNAWYRDGFAIVKELLQNADDARAARLDIGWASKVPGAIDHPLLAGPGLFILNDGPFTPDDAQAIRRFGLGNKPDNPSKIGQFGLGLKSVFHLCEAFFYISHSRIRAHQQNSLQAFDICDLCNPWSGIAGHPAQAEWDRFLPSHQQALRRFVSSIAPVDPLHEQSESGWLCLWLPLRRAAKQNAQVNGHSDWLLQPRFPGDQETPPDEVFSYLGEQVAQMLPMLRSLNEVRVWIEDGEGKLVQHSRVRHREGSRCSYAPKAPKTGVVEDLSGAIDLTTSTGQTRRLEYSGVQQMLQSPALISLRGDTRRWPKIEGFHADSGFCSVHAKNDQHAAAYFTSERQAGAGTLSIRWAVFLPLSQEATRIYDLRNPGHQVTLTLHGWFFVDPGRQWKDVFQGRHDELPNDATIEHQWNKHLAEEGTLRHVIPALERLASANEVTLVEDVTSALAGSDLFLMHGASICAERHWLLRLTKTHAQWQSVPHTTLILKLPATTDQRIPYAVFPGVSSIAEAVALTLDDSPCLTVQEDEAWPAEYVLQLLEGVTTEVFRNREHFSYLTRTLESIASLNTRDDGIVRCLLTLARQLMLHPPETTPPWYIECCQKLLALIPPEKRLRLTAFDGSIRECRRLAATLQQHFSDTIITISDFDPETCPSTARLSGQKVVKGLEVLSQATPVGRQIDDFLTLRARFAVDLVNSIELNGASLPEILKQVENLALFPATSQRTRTRRALTLRDLVTAQQKGMLFVPPGEFLEPLQAVLADDEVLLIQPLFASLVEQTAGRVPSCLATDCLRCLCRRPVLTSEVARIRLLVRLVEAQRGEWLEESVEAVRYLLHGNHTAASDGTSLLAIPTSEDPNDPWVALARAMLTAVGQTWRLVALDAVNRIPRAHWHQFNVQELTSATTAKLVTDLHTSPLWSAIAVEVRTRLGSHASLRALIVADWPSQESKAALKALPIFESLSGALVSITSNTRSQGDYKVPQADLLGNLEVIRVDPTLGHRYIGAIQELAPPLTLVDAVRQILLKPAPHSYAQFILQAVRLVAGERKEITEDLATKPWLPTHDGRGIAPRQIVYLPEHEKTVSEVLNGRTGLSSVKSLDSRFVEFVREEDLWGRLTPLFLTGQTALEALGRVLAGEPAYGLGIMPGRLPEALLPVLLDTFSHTDSAQKALPVAIILKELHDTWATDDARRAIWRQSLLQPLQRPLPAKNYRQVLLELAEAHERMHRGPDQDILAIFCLYLEQAAKVPDFSSTVLSEIRLRNRRGEWVSAENLTTTPTNTDDGAVIDENLGKILANHIEAAPRSEPPPPLSSNSEIISPKQLHEYLVKNFSDLPGPAVAAVCALLAGDPRFVPLRNHFGEGFPIDMFQRGIRWTNHRWFPNWQEAIRLCRFELVHADPDKEYVLNVQGNWIAVNRKKEASSLFDGFDGHVYVPQPNSERLYRLHFRAIPTEGFDRRQKLALLHGTAQTLVTKLYGQPAAAMEQTWELFTDTGQLEIDVAQRLILKSNILYLRGQLGVQANKALKELFRRADEVREREAIAEKTGDEETLRQVRQEYDCLFHELQSLLTDDAPLAVETQQLIIRAIQNRLESNSYRGVSVPFELFQNADDAVVEREVIEPPAVLPLRCKEFVVQLAERRISFLHWGRPINQYRSAYRNAKDQGFGRDLEKMLVLSASDKDADQSTKLTTGKFGLGFKSVFFITEQPRVISGPEMRFRVRGGIYPEVLPSDEQVRLQSELQEWRDNTHTGTLIELPLKSSVTAEPLLSDFRRLAHLLVVFARRINTIRVRSAKSSFETNWKPTELLQTKENGITVEVGQLRPFATEEPIAQGLVIRSGEYAILFGVSSTGFNPKILSSYPDVWVTTPTTSQQEHLGFCINGNFDLNPGRTQLRCTDFNEDRARAFGKHVGDALCRLWNLSTHDWSAFRAQLRLAPDTTFGGFWTSLWDLLIPTLTRDKNSSEVIALVRWLLASESESAFRRFVTSFPAAPTNLPSPFDAPVCAASVRFSLSGVATHPEVFDIIRGWPTFQDNFKPGILVDRNIAQKLSAVVPDLTVREMRLIDFLKAELNGRQVDGECADRLGDLFSPEFLNELAKGEYPNGMEELPEIRACLASLEFMNEERTYRPSSELLVAHKKGDSAQEERMRADFAPPQHVLSRTYGINGILFLLAARGPMRSTAKTLAEWAIAAKDDPERQKAALLYLAKGEQSAHVGEALGANPLFDSSWLADADKHSALPSDINDRAKVLGNIGLAQRLVQQQPMPAANTAYRANLAPNFLERLYDVWCLRRGDLVDAYEKRVYPGGVRPRWTGENLAEDSARRRDWMILLMLGALHTMGRSKIEQHRGFLELCSGNQWLDVFASPTLDASQWVNVLDEYLNAKVDASTYYHWMNHFVPFYQFARWLPEYAELFLTIGRDRQPFQMNDYTRPRASARMSGGGVDAPPISRTLGVGACFVLRELVRTGTIQSGLAHSHCYVPSRSTLAIVEAATGAHFENLGTERWRLSERVYQRLRDALGPKATFDLAFDIPFFMFRVDNDFREEVCAGTKLDLSGIPASDEADDDAFLVTSDDPSDGRPEGTASAIQF